jgi:hypothetical protein
MFCRFVLFSLFFVQLVNGSINYAQKEPESYPELAKQLVQNTTTDSSKVAAIYSWITNSISYDYRAFMSGEPYRYQSPDLVYRKRKTTCTGYVNLAVAMLKAVGVEAMEVEGFTRDYTLGIDTNLLHADHAWLAFKSDGNWYLCDPTWDAGYIGIIQIDKLEKSSKWKRFWEKIRDFLSRKKKKKSSNRKKVNYKMGFIKKPSKTYFFSDPNVFLKTHLPSVAHWQMKSRPIKGAEFTDSTFMLNDSVFYRDESTFDYRTLNDSYATLSDTKKLLWLSDSVYHFHRMNVADKAIHAHNYIVSYAKNRSFSEAETQFLIGMCDTVLTYAPIAQRYNRTYLVNKKRAFQHTFSSERKLHSQAQKSYSAYFAAYSRSKEIFKRGKDRLELNELKALSNLKGTNFMRFDAKSAAPDSIHFPDAHQVVRKIEAKVLELKKVQEVLMLAGDHFSQRLTTLINGTYRFMEIQEFEMYKAVYLNEYKILKYDDSLAANLKSLERFFRDTVNHYLGNRKSYLMLKALSVEINKAELELRGLIGKHKNLDTKAYMAYFYKLLDERIAAEQELIQYRLEKSIALVDFIDDTLKMPSKNLGLWLNYLLVLRTSRQTYLHNYLNAKVVRPSKMYTLIIRNAKTLKGQWKMKKK